MKQVKVSDEVHVKLKALSEKADISIGDVIEASVGDIAIPADLDKVLVQMHMRFDELFASLSSFSFPDKVVEDSYESPEEARRREFEKLQAMDVFQRNAINHPEDEVQ